MKEDRGGDGQTAVGAWSSSGFPLTEMFFPAEEGVPCLHILKSEKSYFACTVGVPGAFVKQMEGKDRHISYSGRRKV